jgi:hypothetical protein
LAKLAIIISPYAFVRTIVDGKIYLSAFGHLSKHR